MNPSEWYPGADSSVFVQEYQEAVELSQVIAP